MFRNGTLLRKVLIILTLTAISLLGFSVVIMITAKRGVGTPSDAVQYIYMARSLYDPHLAKGDFSLHAADIWLKYPPLFPFSLAALHWSCGLDPLLGSRWLNASLFGMNIFLAGLLIFIYMGSAWLAVVGSLWMVVKVDIVSIHSVAMSEPLFLFFALLWVIFLLKFLETRRIAPLLGCSVAAALACLTRFSGIPLILTGLIILLFDKRKAVVNSRTIVLIFLFVSLSPMVLWMIKNFFDEGRFFYQTIAVHLFPTAKLNRCSWPINVYVPSAISLPLTASVVLLGWIMWRKRETSAIENISAEKMRPIVIIILFLIIYVLLWAITVIFFSAMAIDLRHLLPLQIFGLFFCLCCVRMLFLATRSSSFLKLCFAFLFSSYLIGTNSMSAANWFIKRYDDGIMYSGKAWDKSEIIQEVKKIPPNVIIYTNNINALYIKAGRESIPIEPKISRMSLKNNPRYDHVIRNMKTDLYNRKGIIVYCSEMCEICGLPTIDDLKKEIPLKLMRKVSDGEIYVWDNLPLEKWTQ